MGVAGQGLKCMKHASECGERGTAVGAAGDQTVVLEEEQDGIMKTLCSDESEGHIIYSARENMVQIEKRRCFGKPTSPLPLALSRYL